MHRISKIPLSALNPILTCRLCNGYLVDAVTIVECLHSFCRSCIVRHLVVHINCPVCDTLLHKTRPHYAIRPDRVLQSLVYKLIPGLFRREMAARKAFYAHHQDPSFRSLSPEKRGELTLNTYTSPADEPISLELNYWQPGDTKDTDGGYRTEINLSEPNRSTYLLCPPDLTIAHLEKLIRIKFGLAPNQHKVVLFIKTDDLFENDYTLSDLACLYAWRRVGPMKLFFTIIKSPDTLSSCSQESSLDFHSTKHEFNTLSPDTPITTLNNQQQVHSSTDRLLPNDSEHHHISSSGKTISEVIRMNTTVQSDIITNKMDESETAIYSHSNFASLENRPPPPIPMIVPKCNPVCSPRAC